MYNKQRLLLGYIKVMMQIDYFSITNHYFCILMHK